MDGFRAPKIDHLIPLDEKHELYHPDQECVEIFGFKLTVLAVFRRLRISLLSIDLGSVS